jgi:hypothetical protein
VRFGSPLCRNSVALLCCFVDILLHSFVPKRGYCASVERGAGSKDFESREQELSLNFCKYRNSTKNRNFDGYFFQKIYFRWKLGPSTVDAEDPSTLFSGRYSLTFFGLESCITFNSRKGYLLQRASMPELGAQGPCGHQVSPMDIGHVHWLKKIIVDLKKFQIFFFHFFCFLNFFLKHFMFGGPSAIASAPKV